MKITLLRTGGIIPMTKKAEKEVDWSKEEMKELLSNIRTGDEGAGENRDATEYQLSYNTETFSIDWQRSRQII